MAQGDAGLSGTVRDLRGRPQMGVLVELLSPNRSATALTDLEGHYQIRNVLPGVYQLRTTATLYLPTLRRQLRLQPRMTPVVDVTMSELFDETSWLSGARLDPKGQRDDWKWTLRSPANRPMLRLLDDGGTLTSASAERGPRRTELHGTLTLDSASGCFGSSGTSEKLTVVRQSRDQKKTIAIRTRLSDSGNDGSPLSVATLLESEGSMGEKRSAAARLSTFPQVRSAEGSPLTVVQFGSAERMQVGEFASLEIGSETQFITSGASAFVNHPFLRLTSHPEAEWSASYALATSPTLSAYEDLGEMDTPVPAAIRNRQGLSTESGLHQEIVVRRKIRRAQVEVVYSHDDVRRTLLTGKLLRPQGGAPLPYPSSERSQGMSLDSSNGAFRIFAPGSSASGFGASLDVPVGNTLAITGGYVTAARVALLPGLQSFNGGRFMVGRSGALLAAVKGRFPKTGTRVSVSYRWQPDTAVSLISPYSMPGTGPYLGVHLRQAIAAGKALPTSIEIAIDGDNVAAQGYQSFSVTQQEALLASALRDLRAGLSFTF